VSYLLYSNVLTLLHFTHSGTLQALMKRSIRIPIISVATLALFLGFHGTSYAEQSFNDLSEDHPVYEAAEYLKSNGIISGYSDGTFKPDKQVNRAEALKIIIGTLVTEDQLSIATTTNFSDVPEGSWYLPYVEIAKVNGIIDGPPEKDAFNGESPVKKVEFIKILLLANQVDPNSYSEIQLPLASDVTDTNAWFYPYMRYALTASMTMIAQDGLLHPARELTRGETALLIYRYLMYKADRRTQALLSETESEILVILSMLENNNIEQAEYASARALLAARGAHASRPNESIVVGALKVSEAFRALVRAYRSGVNGDFAQVEKLAKDAWSLGEQAKTEEPSLGTLADQVQTISQNMAESARNEMDKEEETQ